MLFMKAKMGREVKIVLEDEYFSQAGKGKCWRCFRKIPRGLR